MSRIESGAYDPSDREDAATSPFEWGGRLERAHRPSTSRTFFSASCDSLPLRLAHSSQ
jgi:hypothetical protein